MTRVTAISSIETELHDRRLIDVTDIAREQRLTWRVFITPRLLYGEPLRGRMAEVYNLLLAPRGLRWIVNSGARGPKVYAARAVSFLIVYLRLTIVKRNDLIIVVMASEFDDVVDYEQLIPENGIIPFLL